MTPLSRSGQGPSSSCSSRSSGSDPRLSASMWNRLRSNRRAEPRPELGADVEPGPLAHLVADRLRRHPAVALELAAREPGPGEAAVPADEGQRGLPVPDADPGWYASVVGIASCRCRPMSTITRIARKACDGEHPEQVVGVLEVAELLHQPLRVERPALAVAGVDVPSWRWKLRQPVLERHAEPHLEVMARDALVVRGAHLRPEREARSAPLPGTRCAPAG